MNNFEIISRALLQSNAVINKLNTETDKLKAKTNSLDTSKEDSFIILNTDAFSGLTFDSGSFDLTQDIILNLFNISSKDVLCSQFRDYDKKTFILKPTINSFTVDSFEYTIISCSPCVGKIIDYGNYPVLCLTFLIGTLGTTNTALFYFNIFGFDDTEMAGNLLVDNFGEEFKAKQDKLVSGTNIKTINGQSILGSGDIIINYPEVNHGTSDTTFTLTPNTFHVWGQVTSLTLTFGSETSGMANEYIFQFTSGPTATSLTLPNSIKWANGIAPTIAKNKIYQVSILKGLASVLEFSNN